jgi:hypothetical protein
MQQSPSSAPPRAVVARVIEIYNPGVTMLVAIWSVGFSVRTMLIRRGALTQIADEALLSLLLVVPLMLIGWGLLTVAERITKK